VKADSLLVEAIIDASEKVKESYDRAVTAGHMDIAAHIRRAQWELVAAVARMAKMVVMSEEMAS
jgi:hypothetical protein